MKSGFARGCAAGQDRMVPLSMLVCGAAGLHTHLRRRSMRKAGSLRGRRPGARGRRAGLDAPKLDAPKLDAPKLDEWGELPYIHEPWTQSIARPLSATWRPRPPWRDR